MAIIQEEIGLQEQGKQLGVQLNNE